ncbi:HET-domain-containing protein [Pilatotrama ljubarskyi]|nr:HET-domain-containing protein [Pilatotrama ljubarskyi]
MGCTCSRILAVIASMFSERLEPDHQPPAQLHDFASGADSTHRDLPGPTTLLVSRTCPDGVPSAVVQRTSVLVNSAAADPPTRPSSVCDFCWEGPVRAQYGLLSEAITLESAGGDLVPRSGGFAYSTSWAEIETGARSQCVFCRFLYTSCENDDEPSTALRVVMGTTISQDGIQELRVYIDDDIRFRGTVATPADDPAAPYIVARSPILTVGSPRALSLAAACITDCEGAHERCEELSADSESDEALLPTRVIDCTDPRRPRLATTDSQRGRYLALSYVWGEAQPHRTVMANVAAYADGINSLPQTIRDAIRVTHDLGFRHLWIDSLCIIQDSDEDKRRELGRMHRIYRNAYLTIIAASAQKVGEGFLQDRPAPPHDVTLPFMCPSRPCEPTEGTANDPGALTRPQIGTVHLSPRFTSADGDIELYSHAQEPISARGWCMQEYFMSLRALIFTSQTLQFRCQTTTQNIGGAFYSPLYERRLPDMLLHRDPPVTEPDSEACIEAHHAWQDLVADYSRRAVSNASDRLVACGALAEEFQRVLHSDYLAGLWRDRLLAHLLWFKRENAHLPRPEAYRAPSWSWPAVDGGVETMGRQSKASLHKIACAEVVRCEVVLEDAALPFGQVTAGTLVLRAAMRRCALLDRGPGARFIQLQSPEQARRWAADGLSNSKIEADSTQSGWVYVDSEEDAGVQEMWAVPLVGNDSFREGLLVTAVNSLSSVAMDKVYRRIGWFYVSKKGESNMNTRWDEFPLTLIEVE